ncbi:hypothetical protein SAMN04489835_5797 [Mycolicibacterium rutilum]|uniref:Uncharacterized protein n=1 Tax=Mycolicibacterium rutilum TaxID=370526 RepID=A0A1H6LVF2_MYCRU|nr:hypothetical protein [Mycolicibacterium rutilum]SEH92723.1 hypothetical protein SAMN04489835_5797 [Mycolicibacterium rutilum]
MVSRQILDDGSTADLPWAAAFDPAANARVLSSVQARGFRAATEVVNRFVRLAEPDTDSEPRSEPDSSPNSPGSDAERVLAAWRKLADRLLVSLNTSVRTAESDTARVDFDGDQASGRVALVCDGPGTASSEVWLHNGGAADLGDIRLRCSDLLSHDGAVIAAAAVRFAPNPVPVFARCSRGVVVDIDVADNVSPGCYRGTVLADGHPDVWLPVALTVARAG